MGDLHAWLPQQNGFLSDHVNSPFRRNSNPNFSEIREESWASAEKTTQRVIDIIQPTSVSEKTRQDVILFVQNLIGYNLNCQVFSFGSVPLKTYLPDGDIDLTAIGLPNSEDALASSVRHVLEMEEKNNDAEFEVKDVQYIHAEVKLVKCLVQNIVVDISFNQSGGLSTLCFLEHVDRQIGKDHLFKRSIILIKAWCYYESRILGAHHGLISTYALETLVLYIFHLFHSSLNGPLAVLYKFLDYYSKFDWDRFCISLHGPVLISSLPELVADASENNLGDMLFTKEFLKDCVEQFSINPRGSESPTRLFSKKHLNIVDPLKDNNNLGRSVSKGNFYRIRSAFAYGARKLGRVLLLPSEHIESEVNLFFTNTLERHGSGERPDVHNTTLANQNGAITPPSEELCEEFNAIKLSSSEKENGSREKSKIPISTNRKFCAFPHLFFENGHKKEETESSLSSIASLSKTRKFEKSYSGDERNGNSMSKRLADLSGEFEMHSSNLMRVQWSQDYMMGNFYPVYPRSPSYQYHNTNTWDQPRWHSGFTHMNANGVAPPYSPTGTYPLNSPFILNGYGRDDLPKPRGTGTYFPNMNYHAYKERNSPGRGKNSATYNHFSRNHNNTRVEASSQEANLEEKGSQETPQLQLPIFGENVQDVTNSLHPSLKETSSCNAIVFQGEGELKFGSLGPVPLGTSPSLERGHSLDFVNPKNQGSSAAMLQKMSSNRERSTQAYQLKDEGDFPPLNG